MDRSDGLLAFGALRVDRVQASTTGGSTRLSDIKADYNVGYFLTQPTWLVHPMGVREVKFELESTLVG